jgi:hypothetical protein
MAEQHNITEASVKQAASGNELESMESVADRARIAIARAAHNAEVTFEGTAETVKGVAEHEVVSMRQALTHLEGRIAELRSANTPARPAPPPRVDPDAPKATT